ncbi:MAG: V-type ATP synthase subunit I [Candidatus Margulisiibacteriota bacterium]
MSILETQKIHIVSLKQHKDKIMKCLRLHEVMDIQTMSLNEPGPKSEDQRANEEEISKLEYNLAEIKSAITFLESLIQRKKGLVESFAPQKEEISHPQFVQTCRGFDCAGVLAKCQAIEARLANLRNLSNEMQNDRDRLLPWQSLNLPLNELASSQRINIVLGVIKNKQLADLRSKLEQLTTATELQAVSSTKQESHLLLVYLTQFADQIDQLLSKIDFTPLSLPLSDKTPKEELARLRAVSQETNYEILEQLAEAKKLASQLDKLKYMYDLNLGHKTGLETKQKLADTVYAFVIEGWIKKNDCAKLKTELLEVAKELEIIPIAPAKDEKHPVVLKNPKVFSPFELITKIYGTPKYEEFDPSIPLSFFFALFFGICLGDFGYGLALAATSLYFLKRYRLPEGGQKLFRLLIFGGGVAVIVGMLTGSYLGFSPSEIPAGLLPLKNFLLSIQIIDPMKSPLTLLLFSLALGVIQILFGILLQLALRIRNKQYVSAILDDGLWFFFLSSLVFLIVASALALPSAGLAGKLSLAGAGLLVLTQGRHKKNIIQKFLSGLLSLYKVSGYMGDTLSYSRLLALGMSTTIIGSVINILANMVKGGPPVLGIILMIIILIVGHIFNMIIGTLGAFVHSTRLQMVEFFSKFYEGGGREFKPFKREAEYTVLKQI